MQTMRYTKKISLLGYGARASDRRKFCMVPPKTSLFESCCLLGEIKIKGIGLLLFEVRHALVVIYTTSCRVFHYVRYCAFTCMKVLETAGTKNCAYSVPNAPFETVFCELMHRELLAGRKGLFAL